MNFRKFSKRGTDKLKNDNPTPAQKKHSENTTKYIARNRKRVNDEIILRGSKCELCGLEDNPELYQWHHIHPHEKVQTITKMVGKGYSLDNVIRELKKCALLCPNCHNKIHKELCVMFENKEEYIAGTLDFGEDEMIEEVVSNSVLSFMQ